MPPRARKATPPAPTEGRAATPVSDLDALRAEVAAEPDSDDGPIAVPLADTTVLVKPFLDWPVSANEDLTTGRFAAWARKILAGDDFATWTTVDPTNRQLIEFLGAVEKMSGLPLGSLITVRGS